MRVGLLRPQTWWSVAHCDRALTDIDVVKAATTARRNEKCMARAKLMVWGASRGIVALILLVAVSTRKMCCFYILVEKVFLEGTWLRMFTLANGL
ncbi:hypothetical protein BDR03DRAFT_969244 [Suillus americanus]|nr:hypothetical protein BDR03DRAFT_969244 [Suillus americanus]